MRARRQTIPPLFIKSILAILVLTTSLTGQVPDPVAAAQAPIPGSAHHYIGTGVETVNPADGSLSFDLPIELPRGRGITMKFGIHYGSSDQLYIADDNNTMSPLTWRTDYGKASPVEANGWSLNVPTISAQARILNASYSSTNYSANTIDFACSGVGSYVFRGLDMVHRTLKLGTVYTEWNNNVPAVSDQCPPHVVYASDDHHGTFAQYLAGTTSSTPPPVSVSDQSGTLYKFPSGPAVTINKVYPKPVYWTVLAQSMTDRNGNTITQSGTGYVDSLNRNVVSWNNFGVTGGTISAAGMNSPITLKWTTVTPTLMVTGAAVSKYLYTGQGCTGSSASYTWGVVSEIDLPNGTSFTLSYDPTLGRVNKITFPNGGYVRYVWGSNPRSGVVGLREYVQYNDFPAQQGQCLYQYDNPAITDRYVSFDGSTEVLHQQFSYSTTWSSDGTAWTSKTTTVTSTDSTQSDSTLKTSTQVYTYSAVTPDLGGLDNPSWAGNEAPVETGISYKDGTGKTLKQLAKSWMNTFSMTGQQSVLDDGSATTEYYCFDANEEITSKSEFGFVSDPGGAGTVPSCYPSSAGTLDTTKLGPSRRQTSTAYHAFWNPTTLTGTHIVDSPDSVTVTDGTGVLSQTSFSYTDSVTGSGASVGLVTPPGLNRGNILSITKRIDATSSTATSYTWYDTGNLASSTDGCGNGSCSDMTGTGHTTSYSYGDVYSTCGGAAPSGSTAAYLTQVSFPSTGVAHTRQFCWGYDDGQLRSATDENSQVTTFDYSDALRRLTSISSPDGGRTDVTYDDGLFNFGVSPSFTVTTKQNSTSSTIKKTSFDGMGHQVEVAVSGGLKTDTSYDGLGRAWKVSNPYLSTADTTYGVVTTTHDLLGRPVSVTQQDGSSTISMSYLGPCTTINDEAGRSRKSCVDGLGFMTAVWEDPSGNNYRTDYKYDGLGNLTRVLQAGLQDRVFQYDNLSRLVSAFNPESGQICYGLIASGNCQSGYDANGNLGFKTDARGITTTYKYDNLNRLLSKSYSDSATESACFQYDQSSTADPSPMLVGRLTNEWTASGTCASTPPSSGVITKRSMLAYDPLGRLKHETQCTPFNCATPNAYFSVNNGYDLAGNVTLINNGMTSSPSALFTYAYDPANRLSGVTSSWNDDLHPATLYSVQAFGALGATDYKLGSTVSIHQDFDKRERVYNRTAQGRTLVAAATPGATSVTVSFVEQSQGTPSTGTLTLNGTEQSAPVAAKAAVGSISISGTEQNWQTVSSAATAGTATVTISGAERSTSVRYQCGQTTWCTRTQYDSGTVTIYVNGAGISYSYYQTDTNSTVASALAGALTANSPTVTATASGSTIYITARATGAATNYSLSTAAVTTQPTYFTGSSFIASPSGGTLTGGRDATYVTTYDSGLASVTVNGHVNQIGWGQGADAAGIASVLASNINGDAGANVSATASGSVISLTTKTAGSATNYSLSASTTSQRGSFALSPSGSTLTGGADATTRYDAGSVSVTINGYNKAVSYGQGSTKEGIASSLATAYTSDASSPATATASGNVITFTSRLTGAGVNYSFSAPAIAYDSAHFASSSFTDSVSGSTLTGGTANGIADIGTVSMTVNSTPSSAKTISYGSSDTASTVASKLAAAFTADSFSPVSVTSSSSTITIRSKSTGATTNYGLSFSETHDGSHFASPSFSGPASATLAGGTDESTNPATIYSFNITSFEPNGNVKTVADSVTGTWTYNYDSLNRLKDGSSTAGPCTAMALSWTYDRFGNRMSQSGSGTSPCTIAQPSLSFTGGNNRIDSWSYDLSGNLLNDYVHNYTYDAESRMRTSDATKYIYDAEGRRVAKASASDGTIISSFVLGTSGVQLSEVSGAGQWLHSNIYAGGSLIATYDNQGTHWHVSDWLGTRRVQAKLDGVLEGSFFSYPFGDGLSVSGANATEQNFTGQEFDSESGLYHFDARYFGGNLGRWISPDWAEKPEAVPYAAYGDPQSLNLYQYVRNTPLTAVDLDGHVMMQGQLLDLKNLLMWSLPKLNEQIRCICGQMELPSDPGRLGPEWVKDTTHRNPNGERFVRGDGTTLDFDRAQKGKSGWKGKDHWHVTRPGEKEYDKSLGKNGHVAPGTSVDIPDFAPAVAKPTPSELRSYWVDFVGWVSPGYAPPQNYSPGMLPGFSPTPGIGTGTTTVPAPRLIPEFVF